MRVVLVLVALGFVGCGDNARERPVPVEVRIVSGPSGLVRDPRPSWAFEVRGAPAVVECALDDGAAAPCRDAFTPAADLAMGPHAFTVRAAGAAGDQSSDSRTIRLDAAAPAIALRAPRIAPRTSDPRPVVSFAIDDASQVATTCSLDGGPAVACDASFAAAADLPEGVHIYRLTATDAAGNASVLDVGFVVDVTPPELAVTDGPADPSDDNTPSFSFTTSADTTRVRCAIDTGQIIDPCTTGATFAPLATGARTFTVTAFDDAVPANTTTVTRSFVVGACGPAGCGCGDGVRFGGELCDGPDLGAATCGGLGHAPGALVCNATCDGFDTTGCDGGFVAAADGFTGVPCFDGIKFAQPGFVAPSVVACTEDSGLLRTTLSDPAGSAQWNAINGAGAGAITNLHGRTVAPQPDGPNTLYLADNSATSNGFRTNNIAGATWTLMPFADAGAPIEVFAAAPSNSTNNIFGGWEAARGAVVLHGSFNAPTVSPIGPPGSATGTVRSIAKGAANDIHVAVWGQTPAGDPATGGGIYLTCDQIGAAGGTYVEHDAGIAADDRPRVWSLTVDPSSVTSASRPCGMATVAGFATTYYAALRGGGRIYKTTDGGASWVPSNAGLPAGAEVYKISIDCFSTASATRCADPRLLYAATSAGLYASTDAGGHWTLAGLEGQIVRGVALEPDHAVGVAPRIFVAVVDAIAIYQRP